MASAPPPPPSALLLLQSHFALSRVGGEIRVIDLGELAALKAGTGMRYIHLYKKADAILLMQRFLETQPVPCDPKRTIANFFTEPATRVFDRIAFDPCPTPLATLNLWAPSPVQPIIGDWSILGRFLLDVICSGDTAVFGYLIQFLAHMLQYSNTPGRRRNGRHGGASRYSGADRRPQTSGYLHPTVKKQRRS